MKKLKPASGKPSLEVVVVKLYEQVSIQPDLLDTKITSALDSTVDEPRLLLECVSPFVL